MLREDRVENDAAEGQKESRMRVPRSRLNTVTEMFARSTKGGKDRRKLEEG